MRDRLLHVTVLVWTGDIGTSVISQTCYPHKATRVKRTKHVPTTQCYQTIDWSCQSRALPHFTNRHVFCYSFFLTATVPQKENDIHHSFHASTMLTWKRESTGKKKWCLVLPMLCWNTGWRNSLTWKGQLWKTYNEIPLPARCDWHFCILEEVLRTRYSVQFWWRDSRRK